MAKIINDDIMRIGIDFDNTIICYDTVFYTIALEKRLITEDISQNKNSIRDYLRRSGKEDIWTELQGLVYGARINEALPFPGVINFFSACKKINIPVCIISHKTRYPYRGPKYDLHDAANQWLEQNRFFDIHGIGLSTNQVFFEPSKYDKMDRIVKFECTHFIDDLPEFFNDPHFPKDVITVLFDPGNRHRSLHQFKQVCSWEEIQNTYVETPNINHK